jgi:hypothetical protein
MSKTIAAPIVPEPPGELELSPVPNKSAAQAVEWYRDRLDLEVTPRYLKAATDAGELRCQIVARRRMYSTAELYRFVVTRPGHTTGKRVVR